MGGGGAQLRRRRGAGPSSDAGGAGWDCWAACGDDDVRRPLLAGSPSAARYDGRARSSAGAGGEARGCAVLPGPGAAPWQHGLRRWVEDALYCAADILPAALHPVADVAPADAARLRPFGGRARRPFDGADDAQRRQLRDLWRALGGAGGGAERWSEHGFQRDDPSTDFRAGGSLALASLLRLAEGHPAALAALRAGPLAPALAVASINVTALLIAMLRVTPPAGPVAKAAGAADASSRAKLGRRGLAAVLLHGGGDVAAVEQAFCDVHVAALVVVERVWRERHGADMMQFNPALADAKVELDAVLRGAATPADVLRAAGL